MARPILSDWIDRLRAAERRGDLLVAFDLATQGLERHPDSLRLRYLATRVMARSGAVDQAAALYKRFRLDRADDTDIASLGARIAKDYALAAPAGSRRRALRSAAEAYGEIYKRTHEYYPAINAATLYLLAGHRNLAEAYARKALDAGARGSDRAALDRYYRCATRAEAMLIRRDAKSASAALTEAVRHLDGNFDAAATTTKQLRLICQATRINPKILDVLRPPRVLHYCGPIIVPGAPAPAGRKQEHDLAGSVLAYIRQHRIGFAYGSLAAGGEIICAEACLRAGIELNVVLPFGQDEFVEIMVRAAGAGWLRRFEACLGQAKLVSFATTDHYREDHGLFSYACRLGMGMAILRAQHLDTEAAHVRLRTGGWDPDPRGYAASFRLWHGLGRSSERLGPVEVPPAMRTAKKSSGRAAKILPRSCRALLFGDVKGFSRIAEHHMPGFLRHVMGAIAAVLRRYQRHILYRNSWGDAVYAVLDDPIVAAECGLAIQDAIAKVKATRYGLSSDLAFRLAGHFGPLFDGHDPIRDERMFFGAHTVLAARMEPITAPGQVYVTEAMAAAISMAALPRFRAEYVGNVPLAKGFGSARMYALRRVAGASRKTI
jgi:class 3 adenylate cyclase